MKISTWLMRTERPSDLVGLECASAERAGKLSALDRLFRMQAGMAARAVISSILLYMSLSAALWVVMDATKHVPGSEGTIVRIVADEREFDAVRTAHFVERLKKELPRGLGDEARLRLVDARAREIIPRYKMVRL